jgi:2-octaprenyl-6-methoxyphenol hydroxylase
MSDDAVAPWVAVQGSGPVALVCALLMRRMGVPAQRIALQLRAEPIAAALAHRVIALSQGSLQLLDRVGDRPRAGVIQRVEVSMQGHLGRTILRADELGTEALGAVVRYPDLMQTLQAAALMQPWNPSSPDGLDLLVHAEGDPGDQAHERRFDQTALLTEVRAPQAGSDSLGSAHEKFTAHGPLALLPLPEPQTWSVVWCDRPATSQGRLALSDAELSNELHRHFGARLGPLIVQGPRALAPIARRVRHQTAEPQALWIGNAAQTLHPVAGQGLNLGLRDAFELAEQLAQAWRSDQAASSVVAHWMARRKTDRQALIALTDLMASSFTWPIARPLQSLALGALELAGPVRRTLARTLIFGLR